MTPEQFTFQISVNDGPTENITVPTSIYVSAAAAVPALKGIEDFPMKVRIWVDALQPDYPPLVFRIDEPGGSAMTLIERPS